MEGDKRMKFYVLESDPRSEKPFCVYPMEAKNKDDAYDKYENYLDIGINTQILTKGEFKNLKEVVNSIDLGSKK
jgi:hypothetical protein